MSLMRNYSRCLAVALGVSMLTPACTDYDEDITGLNDRLDDLTAKAVASLEEQIANVTTSIKTLETAYKAADEKLKEELKTQKEDLEGARGELQASIDALESSTEADIAALTSQLDALSTLVGEKNTELKGEIDAVKETLADKADKTAVDEALKELDAKLAGEIAKVGADIVKCQESIKGIEGQIVELNKLIEGKVGLEEYQAFTSITNAAITELTGRIINLEKICAGYDDAIKPVLDQALKDITTIQGDYLKKSVYDDFIGGYEGTLGDLLNKDIALQAEIDALKVHFGEDGRVAIVENKLKEVEGLLEDSQNALDTYKGEVAELLKSLESAVSDEIDDDIKVATDVLNETIAGLQDQIDLIGVVLGRIQSLVYVPMSVAEQTNGIVIMRSPDYLYDEAEQPIFLKKKTETLNKMKFRVRPADWAKKLKASDLKFVTDEMNMNPYLAKTTSDDPFQIISVTYVPGQDGVFEVAFNNNAYETAYELAKDGKRFAISLSVKTPDVQVGEQNVIENDFVTSPVLVRMNGEEVSHKLKYLYNDDVVVSDQEVYSDIDYRNQEAQKFFSGFGLYKAMSDNSYEKVTDYYETPIEVLISDATTDPIAPEGVNVGMDGFQIVDSKLDLVNKFICSEDRNISLQIGESKVNYPLLSNVAHHIDIVAEEISVDIEGTASYVWKYGETDYTYGDISNNTLDVRNLPVDYYNTLAEATITTRLVDANGNDMNKGIVLTTLSDPTVGTDVMYISAKLSDLEELNGNYTIKVSATWPDKFTASCDIPVQVDGVPEFSLLSEYSNLKKMNYVPGQNNYDYFSFVEALTTPNKTAAIETHFGSTEKFIEALSNTTLFGNFTMGVEKKNILEGDIITDVRLTANYLDFEVHAGSVGLTSDWGLNVQFEASYQIEFKHLTDVIRDGLNLTINDGKKYGRFNTSLDVDGFQISAKPVSEFFYLAEGYSYEYQFTEAQIEKFNGMTGVIPTIVNGLVSWNDYKSRALEVIVKAKDANNVVVQDEVITVYFNDPVAKSFGALDVLECPAHSDKANSLEVSKYLDLLVSTLETEEVTTIDAFDANGDIVADVVNGLDARVTYSLANPIKYPDRISFDETTGILTVKQTGSSEAVNAETVVINVRFEYDFGVRTTQVSVLVEKAKAPVAP